MDWQDAMGMEADGVSDEMGEVINTDWCFFYIIVSWLYVAKRLVEGAFYCMLSN
jgi:hypothetical protein